MWAKVKTGIYLGKSGFLRFLYLDLYVRGRVRKTAEPPLSAKRPLKLLSAFPVPGETVTINQFGTCIYWVKLRVPHPIDPEHVIVEVFIRQLKSATKVIYRNWKACQYFNTSHNFLYIGWQWRNFFILYLCQLFFFRHVVRQALQNVSYSDITFFVR